MSPLTPTGLRDAVEIVADIGGFAVFKPKEKVAEGGPDLLLLKIGPGGPVLKWVFCRDADQILYRDQEGQWLKALPSVSSVEVISGEDVAEEILGRDS